MNAKAPTRATIDEYESVLRRSAEYSHILDQNHTSPRHGYEASILLS